MALLSGRPSILSGSEFRSMYIVYMSSGWGGVGESALKSKTKRKKAESLKLNSKKPGATQTRVIPAGLSQVNGQASFFFFLQVWGGGRDDYKPDGSWVGQKIHWGLARHTRTNFWLSPIPARKVMCGQETQEDQMVGTKKPKKQQQQQKT